MVSWRAIDLLFVTALGALGCQSDEQQAAGRGSSAPSGADSLGTAVQGSAASPAAGSSTAAARAPARGPRSPLNVLLITIDAMRADMPWQGYERPIAPFLTELAKQCVLYSQAYSVSSYTAKSVGALLMGRYPSTLYRSGFFFTAYPEANVFLAELLQKGGVRTMSIQAHGYFDRGMKLEQGFDVWRMVPKLKWDAETDENVTAPQSTAIAMELLSSPENTQGPFFLWMQYGDPHDQYFIHSECPKWGRDNRDRYDSEICFVDLNVRKLLEWAQTQSWYEHTAIIIGSDHGEAFGEHEQWKHAFALWELLVRVPLMFRLPGVEPRRIDVRRSYIDLPPTILELMGQPACDGFMGRSMVPELYGAEPAGLREPIVLDLPADSHNPPTFAIVQGDYKLLHEAAAGRFRLYNLAADPQELDDLATKDKDKLAEMRQLYEQTFSRLPVVKPYGGNKLVGGGRANGPEGPPAKAD